MAHQLLIKTKEIMNMGRVKYVMYNVCLCNDHSSELKVEYEQLWNLIREQVQEFEYNYEIIFDIGWYKFSGDGDFIESKRPHIHIFTISEHSEIAKLVENAIKNNKCLHFLKASSDIGSMLRSDHYLLNGKATLQDKIKLTYHFPKGLFSIYHHETCDD